ncbi:hypothetical protein [Mesorhizobium kowhaii]|uniref:Uncharacterized protein n=1 Tax=Mesorhizobium kowhaii TaxID=1300272 RepID=A0A2W7BUW5_9HYPH|nr:hypothetical protein [Mesorhizobium kowhaii]PZV34680.1 hypothetical protein B5V02_31735 [Mesorhizobium kowhaii]
MRVVLDLFSGRPNPSFRLAPNEVAELAARARALSVPSAAPAVPQAGWRGFIVLGDGLPGFEPIWLRVKEKVVEMQGGAWQDSTGIEALLDTSARRHGYGALLDEARKRTNSGAAL